MKKIPAHDMTRIATLLKELQRREISLIKTPNPITLYTVPGKIEVYIQTVLRRCSHLVESSVLLLENKKGLSAVILARSLLETIASLVWFQTELNKLIKKRDFEEINNFVFKVAYSAKWTDLTAQIDDPESVEAEHINNQIRALAKHKKDIMKDYDRLSEHSHPNALGAFRFFSQPESEHSNTYHFNNGDLNFEECYKNTLIVIDMITIFLDVYDQIKGSLTALNQRYEDSLLIKKS